MDKAGRSKKPADGAPSVSLYRNFLNVGGLTLVSRLLGFVRDILMAVVLGTGPAADAFFAAFRFPNLFRRLFAEGAFNAAFVPLFAKSLEQDGKQAAYELAARIISWLVLFLVVLTILAEIFMPYVLVPFVPGFVGDPEKFDLTVLLTRICFPYLALTSLMAAYAGILNALGRFAVAAAAPILLNVVLLIVFIPILVIGVESPQSAAIWVSVGVIVGGLAQVGLVAFAVKRANFLPRLQWPIVDKQVRRFWTLAIPAVMTGGITQINIFVGTIIASAAPSAISYLYYADRLYQLPLGIIGIAVGVVLLPELSRHLKGGRTTEAKSAQDDALLISMVLTLPAALALMVLAEPMVRVLFERGAFGADATAQTATALIAFGAGLPAFVLVKVFQPGFFAREDTVTPTIFAAISVVTNIAISLALFAQYQHVGIAIATSIAAWVNAILLAVTLMRRGHFNLTTAQWRRLGLALLASAMMAFALWVWANWLETALAGESGAIAQIGALLTMIALGAGLYFSLIHLLGVQKLATFLSKIGRRAD